MTMTNEETLARLKTLMTIKNAREWRAASSKFIGATAVMLNRVGLYGRVDLRYAEWRFNQVLEAADKADRAYRLPLA